MKKLSIKFIVSVFVLISSYANAGFISGSHTTDGGKSVDLGVNLEWMSLDYTAGLSRDYIESASGWTDRYGNHWASSDWRYATSTEVAALYNSLWGGTYYGWSVSNRDGANWLLNEFGGLSHDLDFGDARSQLTLTDASWTNHDASRMIYGARGECSTDNSYSCLAFAQTADDYIYDITALHEPTSSYVVGYNANSGPAGFLADAYALEVTHTVASIINHTELNSSIGSLLIRMTGKVASVPEPTSCTIFALGLLGLASRHLFRKLT
jgi:hypothetical protein